MDDALVKALDVLATTPRTLAHLVAEVTEEKLEWSEDGAAWSPRTIMAHLRDGEFLEFRLAIERMLAEESPALSSLDVDNWSARRNRSRDRKELLLADFALQRQATLGVLRGLSGEEWERGGSQAGRTITVRSVVVRQAEVDAEHVTRLESALGETLDEVLARRARPE